MEKKKAMNDFVIFTDANSDIEAPMVGQLGIEVLPMRFTISEKEYYNWPDKREMSSEEFYAKIREGGMSSTTQTNAIEFEELFRPFLQQGKDVLYIGFSSGLSGTLAAAKLAQQTLREEFLQQRVEVVDTLSICLGQTMLVQMAAQMKQQGKTIDEITAWIENNNQKVAHWFTVDDLQFLKRGGRLSGTAALLGTMLNIKPVLRINEEGKLIVADKVRGRRNSLLRLVDELEKRADKTMLHTIFVAHADCAQDAAFVTEEIKKRFKKAEVHCSFIGPVLGGHTGPNAVAVFFYAEQPRGQ